MQKHLWAALRATAFVLVAILASCDEDPPTAPIEKGPPTIGGRAITVTATPASGQIYDIYEISVDIEGLDEADMAEVYFLWNWPGVGRCCGAYGDGVDTLRGQFASLGEHDVLIGIRSGDEDTTLTQTISVSAAPVDGSFDLVPIPQGPFLRGLDPSETSFSWNTPQRQLEISDFRMGRTEVTNAAFLDVMNWAWDLGRIDTVGLHTGIFWFPGDDPVTILRFEHSDIYFDGSRFAIRAGRELYPVAGVLWRGAATFCNWRSERDGLEPCYTFTPSATILLYLIECDLTKNGYRLPTEAEWEKAARGGLGLPDTGRNPYPDRAFPWGIEHYLTPDLSGDQPSSQYANYDFLFSGLMPVGIFPMGRSPYGIDDLFGNVAEWCNDWWDWDYYAVAPATDPPGPENEIPGYEDHHVLRGHSFIGPYIPGLGASYIEEGLDRRAWGSRRYASRELGFRIVRKDFD